MDHQTIFNNQIAAIRDQRMKTSEQITLGELILKLEYINNKDKPVFFDFDDNIPDQLISWRGSYAELCLQYGKEGGFKDVVSLLQNLKEAVGKEFYGYKGGEYLMGKTTPIWIANYGDSGVHNYHGQEYQTVGVFDVEEFEDRVILLTKAFEY